MAVAVAVSDQSVHHVAPPIQVAQLVHIPVAQFVPSAPPREEPTGTFSRRSASASVEVRGGGARQHRGVLVLIAVAAVATAFLLLATLLPTDAAARGRRPPATGSFDKACHLPKFAPPPSVAPDGVRARRLQAWRRSPLCALCGASVQATVGAPSASTDSRRRTTARREPTDSSSSQSAGTSLPTLLENLQRARVAVLSVHGIVARVTQRAPHSSLA